ncbi:hypothetical protein PISL3812_07281 [Talaromyces islandicus]|uniref:Uncharacterized protein n=1 Tax=Talaromyces islandicus TaxID=28573 RepID=A0A0U1M3R5_TALIS|nr:hypothetical protein PISL3812_07281 [Talaromyces islandicus]
MDFRRYSPPPSSPPGSQPSSPPASDPFRLQTRRLQLRNARFRGAHISPRKTARLSSWGSLSTGSIDKENKENKDEETNCQTKNQTGSVRRRVSILQELHDSSSQRGRTRSRRSSVSHLFDDDLSLPSTNLHYKSRHSSPASIFEDHDPDLYRDRGSPLSLNAKRKSRDNAAAASYSADKYIEHLETQLAAVQSRLSPMQASTSQSQVSRLRSLSAEIKVLRQELSAWEDKFDTRVGEEVSLRTELETKLKTKIVFLEGQLEESAYRIKELECERDLQAQKLRNVESLRSTNRGLERRVDVLTELLAQSPTRREPQTPEFSPTRSLGPRLARPRSMLPSVPALTDVLHQPPVAPGHRTQDGETENSPGPDTPDLIPDDSSTMASSSFVSKSQRSSTLSQISSISSQWTVPLPFSSELQGRTPSRPRNMRRFPSGTCTLKPLILPTTTTPNPEPVRRGSQQFDDSALMFSPTSDPDYSPSGIITHGTCLAQEETLAALEGRTSYYQTFDEAMLGDNDDDFNMARTRRSDSGASRYSRLSMNQTSRPCSSYSAMSNAIDDDLCSSPSQNRFSSQSSSRLSMTTTPVGRRRSRGCDRTPKAFDKTHHLSKVHEEEPARHGDTNNLQMENVLHEVKTALGALAHRMFARVWHGSMMRAGKFSWWILTILLGPQRRDEWLKASSLRKRAPQPQPQPQPVVSKKKNNNSNGIGHTLSLWAKFSVTLAVAVVLAIRHGPGALLSDEPPANEHDDNNENNNKTHPDDINSPKDPATTTTITTTTTINPRPVLWTRPLTIEDFLTT